MYSGQVVETIRAELIKRGATKNKSSFAKSIGSYCHIVANIVNGERKLTLKMIANLVTVYDINPNYIFGVSLATKLS